MKKIRQSAASAHGRLANQTKPPQKTQRFSWCLKLHSELDQSYAAEKVKNVYLEFRNLYPNLLMLLLWKDNFPLLLYWLQVHTEGNIGSPVCLLWWMDVRSTNEPDWLPATLHTLLSSSELPSICLSIWTPVTQTLAGNVTYQPTSPHFKPDHIPHRTPSCSRDESTHKLLLSASLT